MGDLAGAVDALAALGVNRAEALARQAGSERAVAWIAEQAKAPDVKRPAALAATLICSGEKPPEGWRPRSEREAAPAHPALMADRAPHTAKAQRDREQVEAENALIARHPAIADRAVERFIAKGGPIARLVARKPAHERPMHPRARPAVLAAIAAETGEKPRPAASRNGDAMHAQEATR